MSTHKPNPFSKHQGIVQAAGVISLGTLSSRILGFVRDMVIARLFGIYLAAQAFVVAFKIPNLLRDMLGEGAANAAFVPVFSEYAVKKSRDEFWELANVVLNLLMVALAVVTLGGILLAGVIVPLIAPGFAVSPEKLHLTVSLTRMLFPYLLLVSLAAYAMAILNSLKHFSIPAFAPCFLNISIVLCALYLGQGARGLAIGALIGGFLQLAVQVPLLYRKGFRWRPLLRFRHPDALRIGRLLVPRMAGSCIYQLNNFVDTIFGSFVWVVGEGGVAVLYFAYRILVFPLGIFSTALSQAVLPTFAREALEDDPALLRGTLSWALRMTFFLLCPAAVGCIILAYPIIETIFAGGRFDLSSARMTALTLACYSIGLPMYGGNRILQSCFFSLKDTRTPMRIAGFALVMNIVLNAVLMYPLRIAGIALATALSGITTFGILFVLLGKRLRWACDRQLLISAMRILGASLGMGAVCLFLGKGWYAQTAALHKWLSLLALVITGISIYVALCSLLKVGELDEAARLLKRER
ncbi:MAG: murein biosynthesis integral membrane protein MurJ [Candidatus Omnitrophica bacterium]|nr:murein biosynthesis integral membrane protein MurJ [Candidatus Omnitrophota bacterium]